VAAIYEGMAVEIGGKTYRPGANRYGSVINLAASTFVTQDGQGDPNSKFYFQPGSTFINGANSGVLLTNGAQAKNVIWGVGSAVTVAADSFIEGSILTGTAITLGIGSSVNHGCVISEPRLCHCPVCRYLCGRDNEHPPGTPVKEVP
jgi:hypothetical protein